MKSSSRILLLAGLALGALSHAERLPVLKQIDLPHPYYFREMYLPQLTAGPSSLAWSPDSRELIYSMAGSLWRQRSTREQRGAGTAPAAGTGVAQQLTANSYDYQPDWSPDGRWVIYSSYRNDAMELWVLDLASGKPRPLLMNGAVNVEPRFSPDGRRIAFVSTLYNGHFHIFTADFNDGALANVERLTGEHRSDLPRYYYSPYDHEINPVWTRDGPSIIYVSNRNHIYGTGGFWRTPSHAAAPGRIAAATRAREIHYEETNWKARPDLSPDGSRLVYSSYLGRSWHNLWVMPRRRRRCLSDRLRRLGSNLSALVAGRHPHRLHLQQERQHGNRRRTHSGRHRPEAQRGRAALSIADGAPASRHQGCAGQRRLGAGERHRCGGALLCARHRLDQRG